MADTEDWRRRRAEELQLHYPGPWRARTPRDWQPVNDGVEPMRFPGAIPATSASSMPRNAEPVERRYRQQPPRNTAPDSPGGGTSAPSRKAASLSSAVRHPLVLGIAVGAALAGAGTLGWMLHDEVEPSPVAVSAPSPTAIVARPDRRSPSVPAESRMTAPEMTPAPIVAPPAAEPPSAAPRVTVTAPAIPRVSAPSQPVIGIYEPVAARATTKKATVASVHPAAKPSRTPVEVASEAQPRSQRWVHPARPVALPGRGFSPSFNCRRATTEVNRAICSSPQLSTLDRDVSRSFYRAVTGTDLDTQKAIDRDQVDFLNQRARCSSNDCIAGVYRRRLDQLRP